MSKMPQWAVILPSAVPRPGSGARGAIRDVTPDRVALYPGMKALLTAALASTLCFGCITSDDQAVGEVAQSVTGYAVAVVAATDTFTASVASNVHECAAAAGVALPASDVRTGYAPRNTLGAGPASGTQFVFAARAFVVGRSTYSAGLYQLTPTNHVYYYGANGRLDFGVAHPGTTQSGDDQGLCDKAPSLVYNFCLTFVRCALYDFECPELPPVEVG